MNLKVICKNGYVHDKRIYLGVIAIALLLFLVIGISMEFDFTPRIMYKCTTNYCENPLLSDWVVMSDKEAIIKKCTEAWCTEPLLPRGVYGRPEPLLMKYYSLIVFLMVPFALLINHLLNNKGKKFELPIQETMEKLEEKLKE